MTTDKKKKKSPPQTDMRAKTSLMDLKHCMVQTDLCSQKLCELEHQKRAMSLFATFLMT